MQCKGQRILANGNVGIGTDSPEAQLTIIPGNTANTSIGGRDIAYGVNAITTSGRTGFLVRNSNNYVQDNDNSAFQFLYPFNDGITSDYKVFRTAKGSTLTDSFWTSINGNGYFAGNVTAASFTGPVTGDITGNITGNINGNVVGDVTGNLTGNVTGNADTATKLKTARNINGTSFDGTSAITTAKWGTARSLNGVSVDGSANKVLEPYVERDDSSNTARYLTFVDNSTAGYKRLNMDTNLNYNPSLNKLYTNVSGDAGSIDGLDSTQFLRSDVDDTFEGSNLWLNGRTNIRGGLDINDGQNVDFGSSDDIKFYYQGSNNWLYCDFKTTGNGIIFKDGGTDKMVLEDAGYFRPATNNTGVIGSSSYYWNNGYFSNLNVNNTLNVRGAIDLADNDILRFGNDDDAEFFCDGSHLLLDLNSGIGNFVIRDGTTTRFTFDDAGVFTATGNIVSNTIVRGDTKVQAGVDGNGVAALTINDGAGNANLTFNHAGNVADQDGNAARITCNTDATTGAYLGFNIYENITQGNANGTASGSMTLTPTGLDVTGKVSTGHFDLENLPSLP